jgi:L-arabinokinase
LSRLAQELSADFDRRRPIRISRAPGRLDVMGGIADYTGSLVCQGTLDRAAAVAVQQRSDRELRVFSFNLFDDHLASTFRASLDALAAGTAETLRRELADPARRWAGYIAGCLFILHEQQHIDLRNPGIKGMNLALLSTVPLGAGVASSAAIEVATMMNLADHFALRDSALDPLRLAWLCQQVENRIVGAPCGIMDQVTSVSGQVGCLLRLLCQPHQLGPALHLPEGIGALGINSNVKHGVGEGIYGRTRCAAFMGHKIILEKMRQMAAARGQSFQADPMNGYLANLDQEQYKEQFRSLLPEKMKGAEFLERYGATIDKATVVQGEQEYHVRQATDHHVMEARRVGQFVEFLQAADRLSPRSAERRSLLEEAGRLMYASHVSYSNNALLGAPECDLLVELVRHREADGLYGAKITGGGSGGTVAVLADNGAKADAAIAQIMSEYEKRTGHKPEAFLGSSPGAGSVGTRVIQG